MLGIPNYQPHFFNSPSDFLKTHQADFEKLLGKTIDRFWLMWQQSDNQWFADGPVILEIEGHQYEFCAYKLDDFSFTKNAINLGEKLNWYGRGEEIPLAWKENGHPELLGSLHLPILAINLLTYTFMMTELGTEETFETRPMMHGIEFVLQKTAQENKFFTIFNALDENGLTPEQFGSGGQVQSWHFAGINLR